MKLFDLENSLDVIKEEYYKAGERVDDIIQSETLKNEIAKATA